MLKISEDNPQRLEKRLEERTRELIKRSVDLDEAKAKGAKGVFDSKYGDKVKVYSIGDFSKEICAGPHIENTSELGTFKIKKEQSSGSGVRRIKAILE